MAAEGRLAHATTTYFLAFFFLPKKHALISQGISQLSVKEYGGDRTVPIFLLGEDSLALVGQRILSESLHYFPSACAR